MMTLLHGFVKYIIPMGNVGHLPESFDQDTTYTPASGTGSVSTLPMSDEEKAAVQPRPMGFIWEEPCPSA